MISRRRFLAGIGLVFGGAAAVKSVTVKADELHWPEGVVTCDEPKPVKEYEPPVLTELGKMQGVYANEAALHSDTVQPLPGDTAVVVGAENSNIYYYDDSDDSWVLLTDELNVNVL